MLSSTQLVISSNQQQQRVIKLYRNMSFLSFNLMIFKYYLAMLIQNLEKIYVFNQIFESILLLFQFLLHIHHLSFYFQLSHQLYGQNYLKILMIPNSIYYSITKNCPNAISISLVYDIFQIGQLRYYCFTLVWMRYSYTYCFSFSFDYTLQKRYVFHSHTYDEILIIIRSDKFSLQKQICIVSNIRRKYMMLVGHHSELNRMNKFQD